MMDMESMFSSAELLANPSPLQDSEPDWLTRAGTSCSPILQLLQGIAPRGFFGRTSPAYCQAGTDGILAPYSRAWGNSGMGTPTECLTLNTVEHMASPGLSHK